MLLRVGPLTRRSDVIVSCQCGQTLARSDGAICPSRGRRPAFAVRALTAVSIAPGVIREELAGGGP